jgi:small subunit ribosomal protein S15
LHGPEIVIVLTLSPKAGDGECQGGIVVKARTMSETTIEPNKFQLHEGDTGSADVQVARLTERINHLTDHLNVHGKDFSTRRGLLRLVARRRKLLDYLADKENGRYQKLLKALDLRR